MKFSTPFTLAAATTLFMIGSTDAHLRGRRSLETTDDIGSGDCTHSHDDPFALGKDNKVPCCAGTDEVLKDWKGDGKFTYQCVAKDTGKRCFTEFGCKNPASIDLWCDTDYLCATSCHGKWEMPCPSSDDSRALVEEQEANEVKEVKEVTSTSDNGDCTHSHDDPFALGKDNKVPCCAGTDEVLKDWKGDGKFTYQCVAKDTGKRCFKEFGCKNPASIDLWCDTDYLCATSCHGKWEMPCPSSDDSRALVEEQEANEVKEVKEVTSTSDNGDCTHSHDDPFALGKDNKVPCCAGTDEVLKDWKGDGKFTYQCVAKDTGKRCFKEFGCKNPASIDLWCDTDYLCATSCHGKWEMPCPSSDDSRALVEEQEANEVKEVKEVTSTSDNGDCTHSHDDPFALGKDNKVPCCAGTDEVLKDWKGDGKFTYQCVAKDTGKRCFKEFGCKNPASIDLWCDTDYLCATSCHGKWEMPCPSSDDSRALVEEQEANEVKEVKEVTSTSDNGDCTHSHDDPFALGKDNKVPCCAGTDEVLKDWKGDGKFTYQCVAKDTGKRCFKEFGCKNPASIDLWCDTDYLCATSCHGKWEMPC